MQPLRMFVAFSLCLALPNLAHAGAPLREAKKLIAAEAHARPVAKQSTTTRSSTHELWDSGGFLGSVTTLRPGGGVTRRDFQIRARDAKGNLVPLTKPRHLRSTVHPDSGRGVREISVSKDLVGSARQGTTR